jgi:ABC-type lipopolysaccharide export system ATPase subunit
VHVLGRGRTMASGTPEQIQHDPAVVDAYLGDDFVLEAVQPAERPQEATK